MLTHPCPCSCRGWGCWSRCLSIINKKYHYRFWYKITTFMMKQIQFTVSFLSQTTGTSDEYSSFVCQNTASSKSLCHFICISNLLVSRGTGSSSCFTRLIFCSLFSVRTSSSTSQSGLSDESKTCLRHTGTRFVSFTGRVLPLDRWRSVPIYLNIN